MIAGPTLGAEVKDSADLCFVYLCFLISLQRHRLPV